jgi:hypothetical protein
MNKSLNNKLIWIWVIVLIILPSILVRFVEGDWTRILGMILLLGFLPIFLFLVSIFVTKNSFLLNPDAFEKKYGEKGIRWFNFSLRAVGVIGGILIAVWVTIPAYLGIFNYLILNQPLVSTGGIVADINTGIIDPVGFINQSIQFEGEEERYSFWYSDYRLRVGESHNIKLLPGTNVVLKAESI